MSGSRLVALKLAAAFGALVCGIVAAVVAIQLVHGAI